MSNATGIDVSKWQGTMDWAKAKQAGVQFAIIRAGSITATTGRCYEDTQFIRNSGLAPQYIPYISYYWYWRPQWSAVMQADYFCTLVAGAERNLRLVVDVENDGGRNAWDVGKALDVFCNRINENIGQWPMVYTRATFFNTEVAERDLWSTLDLWIARYTVQPKPWGNPGDSSAVTPRDWSSWTFWQYTSTGTGSTYGAASASIDLNVFNGEVSALKAYSESLFPGSYEEHIFVSRYGGTLLYNMNDIAVWESVLPYQHKMIADGIYVDESDNREYLVVGDHLVLKAHTDTIED